MATHVSSKPTSPQPNLKRVALEPKATGPNKAAAVAKRNFSGAENTRSPNKRPLLETGRFHKQKVFIPSTEERIQSNAILGKGGFKVVRSGVLTKKDGSTVKVAVSDPFHLQSSEVSPFTLQLGKKADEHFLSTVRYVKVHPKKAVTISSLCESHGTHYEGLSVRDILNFRKAVSIRRPHRGRPDYNYLRIVFSLFKGVHRYYSLMHKKGIFDGHHGDIKGLNFFLDRKQKSGEVFCKPRLGDLPEDPRNADTYTPGYRREDLNGHANDLNALRVMLVEALATATYSLMFEGDTKPLAEQALNAQNKFRLSNFTDLMITAAKSEAFSKSSHSSSSADFSSSVSGGDSSSSFNPGATSSAERGREIDAIIESSADSIQEMFAHVKHSKPMHWNVIDTLSKAICTLTTGIKETNSEANKQQSQRKAMNTMKNVGELIRTKLAPAPHKGFGPSHYSGSPAMPASKLAKAIKRCKAKPRRLRT
jgi:hypothetical protein